MKQYILIIILLISCNTNSSKIENIADFRLSKKSYSAIDSSSGRGKYIIIRFDKPHCCHAAKIDLNNDTPLKDYQLESFDGVNWHTFYHSSDPTNSEFITFSSTTTRAVRLHHIRATKIPHITNFTLYERAF